MSPYQEKLSEKEKMYLEMAQPRYAIKRPKGIDELLEART